MQIVNLILGTIIFLCTTYVSFNHSIYLFHIGGYSGYMAIAGVIAGETLYAMGIINTVNSLMSKIAAPTSARIATFIGTIIVGWANIYAGWEKWVAEKNPVGIIIGIAILSYLWVADWIIVETLSKFFKKTSTQPDTSPEYITTKVDTSKVDNEVDMDKVDTTKVDIQKVDTTVDTSKVDTAKVDTSKVDVPQVDISEVDTKKVDTVMVDIPEVDAAKVDISKVDISVDTAKMGTSKVDTPKVDIDRVDTERVDVQEVDTEKVDMKEVDTEKVDMKVDNQDVDTKEVDTKVDNQEVDTKVDASKRSKVVKLPKRSKKKRDEETEKEIQRVVEYALSQGGQIGRKRLMKETGCNEYVAKETLKILDELQPKQAKQDKAVANN